MSVIHREMDFARRRVSNDCDRLVSIHEKRSHGELCDRCGKPFGQCTCICTTLARVRALRPPLLERINVNDYLPSDSEPESAA